MSCLLVCTLSPEGAGGKSAGDGGGGEGGGGGGGDIRIYRKQKQKKNQYTCGSYKMESLRWMDMLLGGKQLCQFHFYLPFSRL